MCSVNIIWFPNNRRSFYGFLVFFYGLEFVKYVSYIIYTLYIEWYINDKKML